VFVQEVYPVSNLFFNGLHCLLCYEYLLFEEGLVLNSPYVVDGYSKDGSYDPSFDSAVLTSG